MNAELLYVAGNWAAHFALAGILLFACGYAVFAPWHRSRIGRNMMALALVHLVTFGWLVYSIHAGPVGDGAPGAAASWVTGRALVFGAIALVYWWRLFILVTDQVLAPPPANGERHREDAGSRS